MGNTIKAEFYKQFSKVSSFVIPIVIFVVTLVSSLIILQGYFSEDLEGLFTFSFVFSWVVMFVMYILVFTIVPIIMTVGVFSQDFKNNMIASTIASGAKRVKIFFAKILVIMAQSSIFAFAFTLAATIAIAIIMATQGLENSALNSFGYSGEDFVVEFISDYGFKDMLFSYYLSVVNLISLIAVSAFSIIITRNFVGAFFTTVGIKLVLNGILYIISYSIFVVTTNHASLLQYTLADLRNQEAIISLVASFAIIAASVGIFNSREY